MTRLAIIFSLLFVTPAWAERESKAIRCANDAANPYKYEKGFYGDKCYKRLKGRWVEMVYMEATDWSCIEEDAEIKDPEIIDFVAMYRKDRFKQRKLKCEEVELPD